MWKVDFCPELQDFFVCASREICVLAGYNLFGRFRFCTRRFLGSLKYHLVLITWGKRRLSTCQDADNMLKTGNSVLEKWENGFPQVVCKFVENNYLCDTALLIKFDLSGGFRYVQIV